MTIIWCSHVKEAVGWVLNENPSRKCVGICVKHVMLVVGVLFGSNFYIQIFLFRHRHNNIFCFDSCQTYEFITKECIIDTTLKWLNNTNLKWIHREHVNVGDAIKRKTRTLLRFVWIPFNCYFFTVQMITLQRYHQLISIYRQSPITKRTNLI